ncbi:polysaccharide deacetylase family protein [Lactococcus fujiensis]|uniref:Peptidoglycan N-acetylglucosamine deacetylase n=1 Tax=Lactococcus fujiensis JCM 16395 TaxID=1291764 RepID=A0A2A5RNT0_9LACT|nr:polysaccharide deacetylase family protein [Lactococcus fujiensis]PCS01022.1 peptidoglycan N-acetylglucosamine deacetylase [Lactococcus fujiensis JCM 16395]
MELRTRQRRKKKRKIFLLSLFFTLVASTGIGIGVKLYHDETVRKEKIQAYQKIKTLAEKSIDEAYQNPTDENLKRSKTLAQQLNPTDKNKIEVKLSTLVNYKIRIADATSALTNYENQKTEESYQQVLAKLDLLTSTYEAKEKSNLTQKLDVSKKRIEAEAAAEAAKKEAEKWAGKKLIALTFDDGPNPQTTPILIQTLANAGVSATFFPLGKQAQAYPKLIKAEAAGGNEVASHSWNHANLVNLTADKQKEEILSAHDLINSLSGQSTNFYRPPYGSYNATTLAQTNLAAVNWSIDTNDWRYVNNSAKVVQNAVTHAHDGGIILMHDIHSWSVAAVPQIIQELKAQGYTFVTVTQLLNSRVGPIESGKVYTGN